MSAKENHLPDLLTTPKSHGPVAWMVHNRVTPNILMLVFLVGGLFMTTKIKQEVFPEFTLDIVTVRVPYSGSSPEEVEQGIILAVEESVRGIVGVKEITATAAENIGTVTLELDEDADAQTVYQDIEQEVSRITTFPEEAEKPVVTLAARRREVLDLQIYGNASEWVLREIGEQVRDQLLQADGITQVDFDSVRDFEISIEIPQENLRAYNLTLRQVATIIGNSNVELPGGEIKTETGKILLRFKERSDWANEFARIPIINSSTGSVIYLEDIAIVKDTFEDSDTLASYNGMPTINLEIYRVGNETPIGVSDAVHEALKSIEDNLPPGIEWVINRDMSDIYRQRLTLLTKNAFIGLCLVFCVLSLFLEFKLAFWVMMGIPTSFLGAILLLPGTDVTINMISMFAFIIALGIVVDDAIVAGENIYEYRQRGLSNFDAAIRGAHDVSVPIAFSILTNIIAFFPLMFVPGFLGKIWGVIPVVVGLVFAISWVEALFILPSHLAHTSSKSTNAVSKKLHQLQQKFSSGFVHAVEVVYGPFVRFMVAQRYITAAIALAGFIIVIGYAASGRMGFILMPKVESDTSVVSATLPYDSSLEQAIVVRDRLVTVAQQLVEENGGEKLSKGVRASINDNSIRVFTYLTDPEIRPMSTREFTTLWRDRTGAIKGLQSLRFEFDRGGPGGGSSISVELAHRDINVLDRASSNLASIMEEFPNVKDVDDGYTPGKVQFDFEMTDAGRSLGLTTTDVARQVRAAYYGAEAVRQQRGRNEVKVMVRLPKEQRSSIYDLEQLLIKTPAGTDVPLRDIANVKQGRAYTTINRREGKRTITVECDVDPISESNQVLATIQDEVLPQLLRDYPGLSYSFEGRQADMRDAMTTMKWGFSGVLIGIYVLLAIPFKSYLQPLIVMFAIPFGIIGAVIGHKIMGYDLSVISLFGIVALAGVVVNDSLVMVDYANNRRKEGDDAYTAITQSGIRRFRPILLTTVTTFGGLAPMIYETSRQARFMIPMAISLGYGILFATVITLILVPCLYMIVEDYLAVVRYFFGAQWKREKVNEADESKLVDVF
ncbi:MAG TPA: AcrB/AcrD/AcrF family protein [Phycisphaerales bacterium]|nr:AcrB/AcrD/AcrF family protein [Phycisphaerales bacterium]HCD34433.1 AcrB/AcrD/AcrF family protein [Phycisphaerales bacterium]|tara:strand:+ start:137015 stop:140197 length:3183 start_codon:yes stop_codon:yes gene_type:complete